MEMEEYGQGGFSDARDFQTQNCLRWVMLTWGMREKKYSIWSFSLYIMFGNVSSCDAPERPIEWNASELKIRSDELERRVKPRTII